ncbi:MAG: type II toxin-antitoxin system HipA family toxin [Acidobacteria bacterium]|nr:MAG: type II toxin-antitoxin system HipA family toxin [Acidobacteriota bacterium]
MIKELIALLDGRETGRVVRDNRGKLTFIYNEQWRNAADAYPLSLSMPITLAEHPNAKIDPFLWGLLPDNEIILGNWARKFHVSARNAFSLIAYVGEDCAGAVQFVQPARLNAILGAAAPPIEWLDEKEIAKRLRALREDQSAWRAPRDTGQFSLAGAQPKTALLFENKKWGVPSGRIPTTHILKPPSGEFEGHAENEHFCLELARALGLPVVDSRIMHFKDEIAIVIERYDRARVAASLHRVHQEDMCQAFAIPPTHKYQNEGGPGIRDIVGLLGENSSLPREDIATFLDSVVYNWLIAGTDAHAKNYALLIGAGGRIRLAPLYDVASVLPYPDINIEKAKVSMKIGGEYRLRNIQPRHWRKLAAELKLDPDKTLRRVSELAGQLADHVSTVKQQMVSEGLKHPIIPRLAEAVAKRAAASRKMIQRR